MHSDGVALLPKTPSAATARKTRRRVQRRSSAANTVVRRNLRSVAVIDQTVVEQDESLADVSTDSTVSNKGRRKRGIKAATKSEDVKQKKTALQEITNQSQDEDKGHVGKNNGSSGAKKENNNKGENKENDQKFATNNNTDMLNILQATLEISDKIVKDKQKNQGKVLKVIKSKSPSLPSQDVQSASTNALTIIASDNSSNNDGVAAIERKSSDKKLNSQPIVRINSAEVEKRLSGEKANRSLESSCDSDHHTSAHSSRRSSTVKKAKLNVARLSTSRRSVKIHAVKPPVQRDSITASAIKAAKNPSGKQSNQTNGAVRVKRSKQGVVKKSAVPVVITVDDDDDTMIEDTPPTAKQLKAHAPRTTRSKMTAATIKAAVNKAAAAAVNNLTANKTATTGDVTVSDAGLSKATAAANSTEAAAEEAAGRTTRSKTRVKEIEKVLTDNVTNKKQAPPATPGRNIGSRVQQLQQLLCQDEGFGLRPKPATPRVEPQRKRNLEAAASPGRAVTPKRSCKNGKEAAGADAAGGTKTRTLQMSNGSSHVRSVIAGIKKTSTVPTNVVTSFVQRTTPKVSTHEEIVEQKRKEISEKERKHNALLQRRNEEQQRRLEEIRRIRDTHQKQVQIRRMELEQAMANKKYTSAQKVESAVSKLINRADDMQQKTDEILRKLAEEEETITRQLADAESANNNDDINNCAERRIGTRSSAGRAESTKGIVTDVDNPDVDAVNLQKNFKIVAEKEKERLEKERQEKEQAEEVQREKAMKEKQQKEQLELQAKQAEREREGERIRIEQEQKERERRERLVLEEKFRQQQEVIRLQAEREQLERERLEKVELEKQRQREQEKIMKTRQEAKQKLEEAQAAERNRLEAEHRMKEEQLRILLEKQKEAAAKLNISSINDSSCKQMSVSVTDINKQYKGNATSSVSGNTSKAMRISHAEASRPITTGGPVRVATTNTKTNSTAVHNTSAITVIKQPTTAKATTVKQDGQKAFNRTFDKEGDTDSYDMTPGMRKKKKFAPSTEDNYNIDDIDSGDETDDEENPRKRIPAWAQGVMLKAQLIDLEAKSLDGHKIFGSIAMLDLNVVFTKKKERFNKRTSSAIWDEFPSFTRP